MEVNSDIASYLDQSHPNYLRWKRARELSIERGKFVRSVIEQKHQIKNLSVLDIGSGEGGTSNIFSTDNLVVSFDLSLERLRRQKLSDISKKDFNQVKSSSKNEEKRSFISAELTRQNFLNGNAFQLPFSDHSFDLIIIQDVIEHLPETKLFFIELKRVLKPGGIIYLSTPNKYSIFNFISDPHFGLPFVSLLKRETIKKYFLFYLRKGDYLRSDIAELLSLKDLINIFQYDFKMSLFTNYTIKQLFNGNKGIVWSNFHLKLISLCRLIRLDKVIIKMANNNNGIINKFFTPTFYFIFERLNKSPGNNF